VADDDGDAGNRRMSLWERLDRPARAPRAGLSAREIAAKAVLLADQEGLDAVTMRRLATELGVVPMAAYRHVAGKNEVLELMIDQVYGELDPVQQGPWAEAMREIAHDLRDLILSHPWLAHIPSPHASIALTPNRVALTESVFSALEGTGLDPDATMAVSRALEAFVLGATQAEIALRQVMAERAWSSGDDMRTAFAPEMSWLLGTGRFPRYSEYIQQGTRKDDRIWHFDAGLNCLLDGLAHRLESSDGQRRVARPPGPDRSAR
jgi:AcrR family transcriptional regulator